MGINMSRAPGHKKPQFLTRCRYCGGEWLAKMPSARVCEKDACRKAMARDYSRRVRQKREQASNEQN
jgi:hypothetical protein